MNEHSMDGMPASIEAERALLGLILYHEQLFPEADLGPEHFYREAHREIYRAIQTVAARSDAMTFITVGDDLERHGITELHGVDTSSYLLELLEDERESIQHYDSASQRATTYARMIARTAQQRKLIVAAGKISAIALNGSDDPMDEALALLAELGKDRQQEDPYAVKQFCDLMARQLPTINWIVQGMIAEGMTVLGGKQKLGKSWLLLALGLAVAQGGTFLNRYQLERREVLYLALEDNERRLQDRLKLLLPPGEDVPPGFHYALKWPKLDAQGLQRLRRKLDEHPGISLIMIDTWGRAKPDVKSKNGYDADVEAARGVQELAMERNLSIIVTAHLRKAAADDALDELNATTGLSATADNILILKRERGQADASLYGTGREIDLDLALAFSEGFWKSLGDGPAYRLSAERKAVIDVLNSSKDPLGAKEIAQLLSTPAKSIAESTMRKRLFDMKNAGEIKELERGKYLSLIGNNGNVGNMSNVGNVGNVAQQPFENVPETLPTLPGAQKPVTRIKPPVEQPEDHRVTDVTNVTMDEMKDTIRTYGQGMRWRRLVLPEVTIPESEQGWTGFLLYRDNWVPRVYATIAGFLEMERQAHQA